jgi:hypothetical protein
MPKHQTAKRSALAVEQKQFGRALNNELRVALGALRDDVLALPYTRTDPLLILGYVTHRIYNDIEFGLIAFHSPIRTEPDPIS